MIETTTIITIIIITLLLLVLLLLLKVQVVVVVVRVVVGVRLLVVVVVVVVVVIIVGVFYVKYKSDVVSGPSNKGLDNRRDNKLAECREWSTDRWTGQEPQPFRQWRASGLRLINEGAESSSLPTLAHTRWRGQSPLETKANGGIMDVWCPAES
ncbi:hypothetical protein ElyMa_000262400 [Elysia marginata]|uniref:Uncharacterized protein n=1 Tax=Elysia marginata TaxID=1093978 RepID=A0AAV4F693_9GAST|nr:hypothetical protein ElyMa_000262400 [Elysia marginata]